MASGFSGSGDFYSPTAGSAMIDNNLKLQQYRSQLAHDPISPQMFPPRRNGGADLAVKRSLAELERQQQQLQQQVGLLRSVKQRSQYNHASPISPLPPFEFSPDGTARYAYVHGRPSLQQQQQPVARLQQLVSNNPSLSSSNMSFSQVIVPNIGLGLETEQKKMRNRLQEIEKQLLDDNDDDCTDVASVVTSSEWSETMQNLMTTPNQTQNQMAQMPFSASPTSSSSSSSCSSSTSSLISPSSKHSLIEAATAFSDGNTDVGTGILDRLKQASNTRGDPEQRLTAYMVSALRSRLNPIENPPPVTELSNSDHILATQKLYEASPCFKLGFMVANLAILESTRDQPNNVHVLDFDVGQGSQYATLIHALAERQSGKPTMVKISTLVDPSTSTTTTTTATTGINSTATEEERLKRVGDALRKLAERVGVGLKFNVVASKINDLNRESLGCEPNEALVVNFAFRLHKMPDESVSTENPRDELLRLVKGLSPRVVTLVEQEMNCNTAPFVARVAETTSYYQALFDSLDVTMNRDGSDRVKIEECLGRKAANSVACEGRDRIERCEVFGKWRARMGMAGFVLKPLGEHVAESMRAKLNSVYRNSNSGGFTVKEENGAVSFGWKGRVLTVASAWR